jgi:hypothetical protein
VRIPIRSTLAARLLAAALVAGAGLSAGACGKEGPPLPPLRLVPAAASEVVARRSASQVELRFVLPSRNQNGPGRVDLDHVEVFAMTVAPGAQPPPNRDLLSKDRLVGTIQVRPAPVEDEQVKQDPGDKRPSPGEQATFVEELTAEKLKPVINERAAQETPRSAPEAQPGAVVPGGAKPGDPAAAAAPAPQLPTYPVRVYAIRGVTKSGRPGPPAPRVSVPLVSPSPGPGKIDVRFTERAYVISWIPSVADQGEPPVGFNVYSSSAPSAPLNPKPIEGTEFEHTPVRFGTEQCFIVRSVKTVQNVAIESAPTDAPCVSARDIFPPATPGGLTVIATPEGISLSWDANTEKDLAGYLVLRGEAPGDTLQALTAEPVRDTNYRDTTVKPGVTYVYAIVATDTAMPPNVSERSTPEVATAR